MATIYHRQVNNCNRRNESEQRQLCLILLTVEVQGYGVMKPTKEFLTK